MDGVFLTGDPWPRRLVRAGVAVGLVGLFDRTDDAGDAVRSELERPTPVLGVRWCPKDGRATATGRCGRCYTQCRTVILSRTTVGGGGGSIPSCAFIFDERTNRP